MPLAPSQSCRLARIGRILGPKSISVLVDHPSQLNILSAFKEVAGFCVELFVKVDTGYHRAGLTTTSAEFHELLQIIFNDVEPKGSGELRGFYSHAGHSYNGDSSSTALKLLRLEIEHLEDAANFALQNQSSDRRNSVQKYILSVGATPTVTSIQNLTKQLDRTEIKIDEEAARLNVCLQRVTLDHLIELHAGVYAIMDMQQLATGAGPLACKTDSSKSETSDIALTILTEVASLYCNRENPEALIAAGSLALGREPCKSYDGWGIVSDWGMDLRAEEGRCGWQVGRISQEHGILVKDPSYTRDFVELQIGQKIRIFPNHACIAGSGFGWYLIVDSSLSTEAEDEVVAVWVRWRGW